MPSRFPPRWLNYIGLPPSDLGKDPPDTEFHYLGRPARWLKPRELIETYDVYVRQDSRLSEDQYLPVPQALVGTLAWNARIIRILYPT